MFAGQKSAQIREILISESAWEEMTCLFAPSLGQGYEDMLKEIYTARKRLLKKVGIDISLENLILYYKMESK